MAIAIPLIALGSLFVISNYNKNVEIHTKLLLKYDL